MDVTFSIFPQLGRILNSRDDKSIRNDSKWGGNDVLMKSKR